jgi:hypothetical protein
VHVSAAFPPFRQIPRHKLPFMPGIWSNRYFGRQRSVHHPQVFGRNPRILTLIEKRIFAHSLTLHCQGWHFGLVHCRVQLVENGRIQYFAVHDDPFVQVAFADRSDQGIGQSALHP